MYCIDGKLHKCVIEKGKIVHGTLDDLNSSFEESESENDSDSDRKV